MISIGHIFAKEAANENDYNLIARFSDLYERESDPRGPFLRDYNRLIHAKAYRRLKHKTQVFYATKHDHVCTRIEHVNHVAAISYNIAKALGLNGELVNAIAVGHDLGHAPFGHEGEKVLDKITKDKIGETFWHEYNSLRFVDYIELLPDPQNVKRNLNLTYAVRDGIVCHCGEVDENNVKPRSDLLDLSKIQADNRPAPYTWEGCIVKVADKISYLGRDIEDAITLGVLGKNELHKLKSIIRACLGAGSRSNTSLIHGFIMDLIENSTPDQGICFSSRYLNLMNAIKGFNYQHIYESERLTYFKEYAGLIIRSIFNTLERVCTSKSHDTKSELSSLENVSPLLANHFSEWLVYYASPIDIPRSTRLGNSPIYNFEQQTDIARAIIEFISGMTDEFAIRVFQELISFDRGIVELVDEVNHMKG